MPESFYELQTAETTTNYHHAGPIGCRDVYIHSFRLLEFRIFDCSTFEYLPIHKNLIVEYSKNRTIEYLFHSAYSKKRLQVAEKRYGLIRKKAYSAGFLFLKSPRLMAFIRS